MFAPGFGVISTCDLLPPFRIIRRVSNVSLRRLLMGAAVVALAPLTWDMQAVPLPEIQNAKPSLPGGSDHSFLGLSNINGTATYSDVLDRPLFHW